MLLNKKLHGWLISSTILSRYDTLHINHPCIDVVTISVELNKYSQNKNTIFKKNKHRKSYSCRMQCAVHAKLGKINKRTNCCVMKKETNGKQQCSGSATVALTNSPVFRNVKIFFKQMLNKRIKIELLSKFR